MRSVSYSARETEFACQRESMTKELTTLAPSEVEILVGVPRREFYHCSSSRIHDRELPDGELTTVGGVRLDPEIATWSVMAIFTPGPCWTGQGDSPLRLCDDLCSATRYDMKYVICCVTPDARDEVCLGCDDNSPPPWSEEGREHSPNSVQLCNLMCLPPAPRLDTWIRYDVPDGGT